MEKFEIIPATRVHATQLAPHLRAADVLEVKLASGQDPLPALLDSMEISDPDMLWTLTYNRHPVAMFGANSLEGEKIGGIWLLGTPDIRRNVLDFQRKAKVMTDIMHQRYEYLTNFVHEDNLISRRWLQELGFLPVQHIQRFGHGRKPFIQYVSKR